MKKLITLALSVLSFAAVHAQQYGGEVKLKITYKGRPLVGYTITGSINNIDIGGKGVTDRDGNVTLHTEPLPLPQFDVQGKKTCGGATYEWEVSGYVYLDNNYCHLRLEQPINSIAEMSGMDVGLIIGSYGFNCEGSLGSDGSSSTAGTNGSLSGTNGAGTTTSSGQTSQQQGSVAQSETSKVPEKTEEELKAEKKAKEDAEYQQRLAEQKQKNEEQHEYVKSGQMRADGLANQEAALTGSIDRINRNIAVKQNKLAKETDANEKAILEVEIEELTLEKKIKEIKLEKTHREMQVDYLTKVERQDFRDRIDAAETEHDACKDKLKKVKKGEVVESQEEGTESEEDDESSVYSIITETEISEASTVSLKTKRTKLQTKKGKLKANLKMKSGIMKQSKIEQIESDIELIEKLVDLIDAELEKRKEEKPED